MMNFFFFLWGAARRENKKRRVGRKGEKRALGRENCNTFRGKVGETDRRKGGSLELALKLLLELLADLFHGELAQVAWRRRGGVICALPFPSSALCWGPALLTRPACAAKRTLS